ncbi:MAG: TOBE domain-containing protein, partial [Ruegeria sp.]
VRSDLVAEFAAPAWREGVPASGRATLGIRPQDLRPVDSGGVLSGNVTLAERLGIETVVDVALKDGTRVLCSLAEDRVFEPGQSIALDFDHDRAHLFAPEPGRQKAAA